MFLFKYLFKQCQLIYGDYPDRHTNSKFSNLGCHANFQIRQF